MANLNEQYNKKILINPIIPNEENESFDLCFFTYYGKLTNIVEIFNGISIDDAKEIVNNSFTEEKKRNSLQIASFLNFSNIFLYLLTYDVQIIIIKMKINKTLGIFYVIVVIHIY